MKIYLLGLLVVFLVACSPQIPITSFEECVAAGNPVMESYPRQCQANGKLFVEEIEVPTSTEFIECTLDEQQAEACTLEYNPVCGMVDNGIRCVTSPCPSVDMNTFGNSCGACAAPSFGYYPGACEDQTFVVCKETLTGFNATQFAQNSGGVCVEVCPGNYDPYVTQIGVEVCIEHYGDLEIESWNTCEQSSDSCDCVKAYETTDNLEIENSEYRCVPQAYATRLLFRGGVDRLDENGERSVVIA